MGFAVKRLLARYIRVSKYSVGRAMVYKLPLAAFSGLCFFRGSQRPLKKTAFLGGELEVDRRQIEREWLPFRGRFCLQFL